MHEYLLLSSVAVVMTEIYAFNHFLSVVCQFLQCYYRSYYNENIFPFLDYYKLSRN